MDLPDSLVFFLNPRVLFFRLFVRAPLILRLPGRIPAGATLQGPVELVDLMPTEEDAERLRALGYVQ